MQSDNKPKFPKNFFTLILILILSISVLIGCSSSSSDEALNTEEPATEEPVVETETFTLKGFVSDSLPDVSILIKDFAGKQVSETKTDQNGNYETEIQEDTALPLIIETFSSSGTDPPLVLKSVLLSKENPTANLNLFTTLIYKNAVSRAGSLSNIKEDDIDSAKDSVLKIFGFGADSQDMNFNPLNSSADSINSEPVKMGLQSLNDLLTRISGDNLELKQNILDFWAKDISDNILDGLNSGTEIQSPENMDSQQLTAASHVQIAAITVENAL